MESPNPDDKLQAASKALGEPVFVEFPENVWKIRTNLMATSGVALVFAFGSLHIGKESTALGIQFTGLTDETVGRGLCAMLIYLLVHFLWSSFDSLMEWRLRITGTRLTFITTGMFSNDTCDYPTDPRQSTLYNWWRSRGAQRTNIAEHLIRIDALLANWQLQMNKAFIGEINSLNVGNAMTPLREATAKLREIESAIKVEQEVLDAARLRVSLQRFDNAFELFLRSQNLRWLVIDFLAPVMLSGFALFVLVTK